VTPHEAKEMEMSLSNTSTITARRSIPLKVLTGAMVGAAVAVAIGLGASRLSTGTQEAVAVGPALAHAQFLELNTSAMPQAAPIEGTDFLVNPVPDHFLEINTVGIPPANPTATEGVTDEFIYWNVDSFAPAAAPIPDRESTARDSGPR
jgi:hypothetical protein